MGALPSPSWRQTAKSIAEILAQLYGKKIMPAITSEYRKGDIRHCYADINKIQTQLGYIPKVSFENGMAELIQWSETAMAEDKFESATHELRARKLL